MGSRWRSVCVAALATEADLLWCCRARVRVWLGRWEAQRIVASMKLRRARVGDFRFSKRPTPRGGKESRDGSCLSLLLWFGRT